jgi:hypothetical protein
MYTSKHLKHLKHTFASCTFSKTWQAEQCTTGSSCAIVVEKEDDIGQAAARPLVSACATPGDRAHAVPQRAHGGGDNSSRVGAASRGEAAAAAMWSWGSTSRWCGHDGGGEEGQREA